ncbi:MAG: hypothetical protein RQ729_13470, partial [Wenzhouxiangellaceae bacterium]|nr:hypothetical protein [Wenzhouxiangellaceae bacterium]
ATFIPSFILFKHHHPVFDRLLVWQSAVINKVLSHLGFWPAISPRPASDAVMGGNTVTGDTAAPIGKLEIHEQNK